jgi:type VI secretion system protein VasG
MMKDGEGRDIDFKNTLIIMASNAGSDAITRWCADPETKPEPEALAKEVHGELLKTFKPAFLGRVVVVPYYPLTDDVMRRVVELKLHKIIRRVKENFRVDLTYTPELVTSIVKRCTEVDTGARNIDHILTRTLLPELSTEFLSRMADGRSVTGVSISVRDNDTFNYSFST